MHIFVQIAEVIIVLLFLWIIIFKPRKLLGEIKTVMPTVGKKTIRAIDISLRKEGFNVFMDLKVAPEIEAYFKDAAKDSRDRVKTEISAKWVDADNDGLKFYIKSEKMSNKVDRQQVMDNFGNGLMDDSGKINVALLRTVDASEGISIKTNDLLAYSEMEVYIRELAVWTKKFYEEEIRPSGITATIQFEVE